MNPSKGFPFEDMARSSIENCDRPACEETVTAISAALERIGKKTTNTEISSSKIECPPSKDSLGKSSWTLLHSMAAWYPENPTQEEQLKMKHFMDALSIFYPCTYCAHDFQENLQKSPVRYGVDFDRQNQPTKSIIP